MDALPVLTDPTILYCRERAGSGIGVNDGEIRSGQGQIRLNCKGAPILTNHVSVH